MKEYTRTTKRRERLVANGVEGDFLSKEQEKKGTKKDQTSSLWGEEGVFRRTR